MFFHTIRRQGTGSANDSDHGRPSSQEPHGKQQDLSCTENNSGNGKIKRGFPGKEESIFFGATWSLNPDVSGMEYFRHTSKAKEASVGFSVGDVDDWLSSHLPEVRSNLVKD